MYLNLIKPAPGSKTPAKRLGRGISSGKGKTCGKGHKGQKARSGGYHKVGFEGGQMPIQRRIPKSGFTSRKSLYREEVKLYMLNELTNVVIDMEFLHSNHLIKATTKFVKIILNGSLTNAISISGLPVTAGAKLAIEAAGGKVEG
jgi:large subunit ribosomal protein L15